jgi:N-acetylmuramoyl-L-alanine amidase
MYKIYIDGCPQFKNSYVIGNTTEGKQNILIGNEVELYLTSTGQFQVFRPQTNWTLQQIIDDANSKTDVGDLYLAIHTNSGGGRGCEVYAYAPNTNSDKFAKILYNKIAAITPSSDRGIKYTPKLDEVWKTEACAVLVEIAFHDNSDDARWLIDNVKLIGRTLAEAICEYKNVSLLPAAPQSPADTTDYKTLYSNAMAELKKTKDSLTAANAYISIMEQRIVLFQNTFDEIKKSMSNIK